jgi:predicted nucleic acid-binding protein
VAPYYLDSSALVERYIQEHGTYWIRTLTARRAGHTLYTVRVTGPELVSAIARKARAGEVSARSAARANSSFRQDWRDQYGVVEVSIEVADRAMDLAERHGLRGYDAVHLAAALEVQIGRRRRYGAPLTFISADVSQLQAAITEGLSVEDPNAHP